MIPPDASAKLPPTLTKWLERSVASDVSHDACDASSSACGTSPLAERTYAPSVLLAVVKERCGYVASYCAPAKANHSVELYASTPYDETMNGLAGLRVDSASQSISRLGWLAVTFRAVRSAASKSTDGMRGASASNQSTTPRLGLVP